MRKSIILVFVFLSSLLLTFSHTMAKTSEQLIIINKSTNQLAFFDDSQLINTFSVGTGRSDSLTPEGQFKIVNKIKNRPYYTDNIPGGDPTNPLGDRWLGINPLGTNGNVYAIHGNNNANSIGKYVSAGCVRMHNEEIRWLYEQVNVNTPVIILHSKKSFIEIANQYGYTIKSEYKININDEEQSFDHSTVLLNNRVLVPVRAIFESLGATVEYDATTKSIVATKGGTQIELTVGSKTAVIDGQSVDIDAPAITLSNSTFVPLRFISEAFGATVSVDNETKVIDITVIDNNDHIMTDVEILINNSIYTFAEQPFISKGTTMVPMRGIFEPLGAVVQWNTETQSITATKDGSIIKLQIGSENATRNESELKLAVPPQVRNGVTFVPIRFVSESLGAVVSWEQEHNRIHISSN